MNWRIRPLSSTFTNPKSEARLRVKKEENVNISEAKCIWFLRKI
jgi:hypothetical protein